MGNDVYPQDYVLLLTVPLSEVNLLRESGAATLD